MRFAARLSPRSDLGRAVGVADFNRLIRDAEIQNLELFHRWPEIQVGDVVFDQLLPVENTPQRAGPLKNGDDIRHLDCLGQRVESTPGETPAGRAFQISRANVQIHGRHYVHGDEDTRVNLLAHQVHRQIVQQAAVIEEVAVVNNRGNETGKTAARPCGPPQRPGSVHDHVGAGQVAGDAKIRHPEILDVRVAEQSLQVAVEAATTNHGHQRKGVIAQHPFELCLEPGNGLFPIIGEGVSRRHDGAHADSGDDVYGEPRFVNGSDDPCMRESARAAAAEDKADFAPRDISHDTIKVVLVAGSYMKMPVDVAFVQPAYGAPRSGRPGRMKQDESLPELGMSGLS